MRTRTKKAQSGIELMMFISFSLIIFSVFYLIVIQHNIASIEERRNIYSQNVLDRVSYELEIAKSIGHGYQKNFTIPDKILGRDYTIEMDDNLLVLNTDKSFLKIISTENINGNINPGENRIVNIEGIVYAN